MGEGRRVGGRRVAVERAQVRERGREEWEGDGFEKEKREVGE